jgi:hypothetical protein
LKAPSVSTDPKLHVLRPYDAAEAITVGEAAAIARKCTQTLRDWCELHHVGRLVGGRWMISKVALLAFLDGDGPALRAYVAGDKQNPRLREYHERAGLLSNEGA